MALADDDVERHVHEGDLEVRPGPAGSDFRNSALSERFWLAGRDRLRHSWITPVRTWLWKFLPTPGRSTALDAVLPSSAGSPMPDSISSFGDSIAPTQTMTSRRRVRVRPVACRLSAVQVLDAGAAAVLEEQLASPARRCRSVRFGRPSAGSR